MLDKRIGTYAGKYHSALKAHIWPSQTISGRPFEKGPVAPHCVGLGSGYFAVVDHGLRRTDFDLEAVRTELRGLLPKAVKVKAPDGS